MQRLHTLDAEFLYLEDAKCPMHIAALCIFEGPVPAREQVEALCRTLVREYPRYRQRLRPSLFGLGTPAWIEDADFDLDYHVRYTALPSPHDDRALAILMGRVLSQLLDRERPLWECWIVEGLSDGRWAMINKVHHSLVDGQSGVSLLTAWFDAVNGEQLAASSATAPRAAAPTPSKPARGLLALTRGLARLAWGLRFMPPSSIQGTVGAHRAYAFCSVSLADLQRIRHAFGGTVNDVAMSLLAGAYRTLMQARGDDPDAAPLRALVPVSTRAGVAPGMAGNRLAAWFCDLPTQLVDPVQRLRALAEHTRELKQHSHMRDASDWFVQLGDHLPAWFLSGATRAAGVLMHRFPQRSIATITTHVRGPDHPVYCLGRKLLAYYPYVPIMQGARVGSAMLSYAGALAFGITSDYGTVPEAELMTRAISSEMAALLAAAAGAASDAAVQNEAR